VKKCVYCGAELNDDAKACSNCGRILPKEDWPEEKKADDAGKNQSGSDWGGQDSAWDSRNTGSGWESRNSNGRSGQNDQNSNEWGGQSSQNSSGWSGQNNGNSGWNTRNGQNPYGQNPYGQNPYGQNSYGQNSHGNMQGYANQPPQQQKTNTFAIVAFVQGILSVFLNSVLFFIPSVMAIVFGCISLSQLKQNPDQKGKGMAVAGLVLGIVFLILTIVLTILAVLLISTDSEFSRMFQEIYKQLEGGSGV
jgi:RNA polymerase subunit RPABC4/transcription elongation factor Spt4